MIHDTAIGAQGDNKSIKTFNEKYEQSVWQIILKYVDKEKRTNGEVAYVIRDMGDLVLGIMEFYEHKK